MSAMRHEMTLMITTESLGYGTFVVDKTHRIISWNEAATRMLGYNADVTLGRTYAEILTLLRVQNPLICPAGTDAGDGTDVPRMASASRIDLRVPCHRQNKPVHLQVVTRQGKPRWLNLSIMCARTLDGTTCVVHMFRDVTEEAVYPFHSEVAMAHPANHPGKILHLPLNLSERDGKRNVKLSPEHLTPREHEVLELLAQGMATIEIATALGISRVTARNHVTRVIEKLGVKTRLQAVLAASRLGLI